MARDGRNLRAVPKTPVAETTPDAPKGPRTFTRDSLKLPSKDEQKAVAEGKKQNVENMLAAIADMSPIIADSYQYEEFGGGVRAGLGEIVEALNDPQTTQYPVARIQQVLPVMRAMCEPVDRNGFAANQVGMDLIIQTGLNLNFFYLGNASAKAVDSIQFALLQPSGRRKAELVSTDMPGAETVMGLLKVKLRQFKAAQQAEEAEMRKQILQNTDGSLLEVLEKGRGEVGFQVVFQELEGHKVYPGAVRIKVDGYKVTAVAGTGHCQQEIAAAKAHKVVITVGDVKRERPFFQSRLPHDEYVAVLRFHRLVRAMMMQAQAKAEKETKRKQEAESTTSPAEPEN